MADPKIAIDISDNPELLRIVSEAKAAEAAISLRDGGREVARIVPIRPRGSKNAARPSVEDMEEMLSAFGSWADVDIDAFKARVKASRVTRRRAVNL